MTLPTIDHIGFLVPDLDAAIARWSAATGYTFGPIARFQAARYLDHAGPELRLQEPRITFSVEGPPYIELMETTGLGTHDEGQLGVHHLGFRGLTDLGRQLQRLDAAGLGHDGVAFDAADQVVLFFTEPAALDGIRLELISPRPGLMLTDDRTREYPRDPVTGRVDFSAFDPSSAQPTQSA
ncbi:MAG: VOC family protein [Propionibacteriaceae bacterium]|jgi:catechol 2,3-dioxygenase-like lactoylglutathione lyase family enzyme|nr:VOC family protein [Propionibacteriaceae bacterium]